MTKILRCNWCNQPFYDQSQNPIEASSEYADYDHSCCPSCNDLAKIMTGVRIQYPPSL
jgi:hypothetical protein